MPSVEHVIGPFFTWKKASGKGFDEASKLKYEPHLLSLAAWAKDEDVSEISTQLVEFDFLPLWHTEFFKRNERDPAQNTVRLVHNALASFFDYCWRRGLVPLNPMSAIPRPTYEAPMNDWLSYDEDLALATVRKTPLEDIVCGIARLGGLRVEEITSTLSGHVDRQAQLLHVFGTKTPSAVRSVVIFPELDAKLERWMRLQEQAVLDDDRLPLVSTKRGDKIAAPYVWRIVKRVAARAGVRLHGRDEKGRPVAIDDTGENVSKVMPRTLHCGLAKSLFVDESLTDLVEQRIELNRRVIRRAS